MITTNMAIKINHAADVFTALKGSHSEPYIPRNSAIFTNPLLINTLILALIAFLAIAINSVVVPGAIRANASS